jgi:4,5-dihydroxyphthalate decarboxylase
MAKVRLRAVSRTQGNNVAVKDGTILTDRFELAFEDVPVLVHAFRRMVRELAYDVSEMALTTYLCAREHGVRFTALPIFLVRGMHHDKIVHNRTCGIAAPKDLEGRRVGVHRGYTVTTGVWARAILREEHDVDLDRVTWVCSGDEHVAAYRPPGNVEQLADDQDLPALVAAGELPAAVNATIDHPDVAPLIPDAEEAGYRALSERGFYPINHLIVVRDDVLDANPGVAVDLFEAFSASKERYLERLRAGTIEDPTAADEMHARVMKVTGGDPLPYGLEPNHDMLERLMSHAVDQAILRRPVTVESVFAPSTHHLTG